MGRGGGGRLSLSPAPRVFRVSFHNRCALLSLEPETRLMFPWSFVRYPLSARSLVFYETLKAPRIEAGIKLYCFLSENCLFTFRKKWSNCPILIFQEGTPDSIKLLSDPYEEVIDKLAADLGLQRVGWIFTDLVADDVRKGTVKHLRDINTFFLTAEECILAGHLQNLYPSPCILSSSGKFGSKFTTVVVSGL